MTFLSHAQMLTPASAWRPQASSRCCSSSRKVADYVGSRCCLLNGAFAGLALGNTAIEKHLKGPICWQIRDTTSGGICTAFRSLRKMRSVWDPDNKQRNATASTLDELDDLDQIVWSIVEAMPMPAEAWLKSGIVAHATYSALGRGGPTFPDEHWIKVRNKTLAAHLSELSRRAVSLQAWESAKQRGPQ